MREIKFRGYAYRDDEWRYGYYITDGVIHEINVLLPDNKTLYGSQIEIESLGQYTGLKDKNGVEIYEGDILTIHYSETQKEAPMQVEYEEEDGAFRLNRYTHLYGKKQLFGQLPVNVEFETRWEVIGNIYENKELLEG